LFFTCTSLLINDPGTIASYTSRMVCGGQTTPVRSRRSSSTPNPPLLTDHTPKQLPHYTFRNALPNALGQAPRLAPAPSSHLMSWIYSLSVLLFRCPSGSFGAQLLSSPPQSYKHKRPICKCLSAVFSGFSASLSKPHPPHYRHAYVTYLHTPFFFVHVVPLPPSLSSLLVLSKKTRCWSGSSLNNRHVLSVLVVSLSLCLLSWVLMLLTSWGI